MSRESQESDRGEGVGHTQCMEHAMTATISNQQRVRMAKPIPYLDTRRRVPRARGISEHAEKVSMEVSGGHTGGARFFQVQFSEHDHSAALPVSSGGSSF